MLLSCRFLVNESTAVRSFRALIVFLGPFSVHLQVGSLSHLRWRLQSTIGICECFRRHLRSFRSLPSSWLVVPWSIILEIRVHPWGWQQQLLQLFWPCVLCVRWSDRSGRYPRLRLWAGELLRWGRRTGWVYLWILQRRCPSWLLRSFSVFFLQFVQELLPFLPFEFAWFYEAYLRLNQNIIKHP